MSEAGGTAPIAPSRARCAGWVPETTVRVAGGKTRREPARRCGTWLDPALVQAGETTHPGCHPGPRLAPAMEQAVTSWLGSMTPEGVPGPDPWQAAAEAAQQRALAAATEAEAAGQDRGRELAARLAEVDRLAAETRVTGAQVHAALWPDGPPWERGMRLRPRPPGWPAGTNGAAANRGAQWQAEAG